MYIANIVTEKDIVDSSSQDNDSITSRDTV